LSAGVDGWLHTKVVSSPEDGQRPSTNRDTLQHDSEVRDGMDTDAVWCL